MSEIPTSEDPFDNIDLNDLHGWIKRDSSRMCETDNGKRLEGDQGDRYQDSWIRFDND